MDKNDYFERYNIAREKRIEQTLIENPHLTRDQAIDHIDFMDSESYSSWAMGNKTRLDLSDEKMERALAKELESTSRNIEE